MARRGKARQGKAGVAKAARPGVTKQSRQGLKKALGDNMIDSQEPDDIYGKILSNHKDIKSIKKKNNRTDEDLLAIKKDISELKSLMNGSALKKAMEDKFNIHDLYRILWQKVYTSTEVPRTGRTDNEKYLLSYLVIREFDKSDRWWMDRENYTLERWRDELLDQVSIKIEK